MELKYSPMTREELDQLEQEQQELIVSEILKAVKEFEKNDKAKTVRRNDGTTNY